MTIQLSWACPSPDDMPFESFEDLLDALSGAGYVGIEPLISDPYEIDQTALNKLLSSRNLHLTGLRTGAIAIRHGLTLSQADVAVRAEAIRSMGAVIRYGANFGKPKILVGLMLGELEEGIPLSDALNWIADGLRECAAEAGEFGLEIDVEPVNRYELGYNRTVAEGLALLDTINAFNVKLLLDTFHMNIEEESIDQALALAGDRIGHIHLADSNRAPPGQGHFDFRSFFEQLDRIGYAGSMTVECETDDPKAGLRESIAFLSQYLA